MQWKRSDINSQKPLFTDAELDEILNRNKQTTNSKTLASSTEVEAASKAAKVPKGSDATVVITTNTGSGNGFTSPPLFQEDKNTKKPEKQQTSTVSVADYINYPSPPVPNVVLPPVPPL